MLETRRFVIVERPLPRPFPGPDKVALSLTSSGASLKVAAKAVIKKEKDAKVMAETKGGTSYVSSSDLCLSFSFFSLQNIAVTIFFAKQRGPVLAGLFATCLHCGCFSFLW